MAIPQKKFREVVFLLLYSYDLGPPDEKEQVKFIMDELEVTKQAVRKAHERMLEIVEKLPAIDVLITEKATSYEFERIQSVERNVLRLGVYELLFDETIPAKVALAEALRLAKKFGTPESASFVNAILDSIYKTTSKEE